MTYRKVGLYVTDRKWQSSIRVEGLSTKDLEAEEMKKRGMNILGVEKQSGKKECNP